MKLKYLVFPLLIIPLTSCNKEIKVDSFYFSTYTEIKLFEGRKSDAEEIDGIFSKIDKLTDNYLSRDVNNVYKINNTSENIQIDPELYDLLSLTFSSDLASLNYFNPLCGSLSKKWKNSLKNHEILDEITINSELEKMNSTTLEFLGDNAVKRTGEAEIDLGAVAKGYALDKAKDYLDGKEIKKYLIDAGSSSILLGEKNGGKEFKVKVSDLNDTYLMLKNCVVSTSSYSSQKVEIDGKNYSHIINPITGSALNENDAVIVISDKGYLGDILSTAFINESLDSIKALEQQFNVKTIVVKNNEIAYKNEGIEVTNKWKKHLEMTSF